MLSKVEKDSRKWGKLLVLWEHFNGKTVYMLLFIHQYLDRVKRIWYLSPMRAAKVQASLTFAARSYKQWVKRNLQTESQTLAPLNGWTCAVKTCHNRMLDDTNWLDAAHLERFIYWTSNILYHSFYCSFVYTKSRCCMIFWNFDFIINISIPNRFYATRETLFLLVYGKLCIFDLIFWGNSAGFLKISNFWNRLNPKRTRN